MKIGLARNSLYFFYFLLSTLLFCFNPTPVSAQNADCDSGWPRNDFPVYIYDQRGTVRFGPNGQSCLAQGANISRVSGIQSTSFSCSPNSDEPAVDDAFVATLYRCNPISSTAVFNITAPPGYTCSNAAWRYYSTSSGFGGVNLSQPILGTGCQVSVPYPPSEWDRQAVITINLPDPTFSATCNSNGTATISWSSVSGATEYGWRLNNRANGWGNWTTDSYGFSSGNSANVPIIYGQSYEVNVTATNSPGRHPYASSWSPAFTCSAPLPNTPTPTRTPTPTPTRTPTPTPTPTPCPVLGAPVISAPNGTIPPGTRAITWNAVPGASSYALRVDNNSVSWSGTCASTNPGDVCQNVSGTSFNYNFTAGTSGNNYRIWVHAISSCNGAYSSASTVRNINIPAPTPTPFCTDSDGGNQPNTAGSTRAWFTSGTNNTVADSCSGSTLTEYYCSGATRTSTTHTCPYGCTAGRCDPPRPDIVPSTVTRDTNNYTIRYCNSGPASTATRFDIRVANSQGTTTTLNNLAVPAANGACTTTTVPCSAVGDTFGGVNCNEDSSIVVTVDINGEITEFPPNGENNNVSSTFNFSAVAGELFYKLKDTSLHRQRSVDVGMPAGILAYDADDAPAPLTRFVMGSAGIVTSTNTIRIIGGNVSTNNFRKDAYTDNDTYLSTAASLRTFIEYAAAQKPTKTITNSNEIESNKVNIFGTGTQTLTLNAQPTATDFVLLVNGNVTITANPTYNTTADNSIAILATGTITIANNISTVNAILIGNNVVLGTSATPLKINGNLISNTPISAITRNRATNPDVQPNLFIVFKPKMYLDLLPHLSDITIEGRQVE